LFDFVVEEFDLDGVFFVDWEDFEGVVVDLEGVGVLLGL